MKFKKLFWPLVFFAITCSRWLVPDCAAQTWPWAKSAGGTSLDNAVSIARDAGGNVFITGYYYGSTLIFGSVTINNTDPSGNTHDLFVAKYDASGNLLWAKNAGGTGDDFGFSVSADAAGNVFVSGGYTSSKITFGSIVLTNISTTSAIFWYDSFIAKYDANGNVLWAKSGGGVKDEVFMSVSADGAGNAFVTGNSFSPTCSFGPFTFTNTNSSGNTRDVFVVKYDANGNELWAKSAGGMSQDVGYAVHADVGGNVLVTGAFSSSAISFGSFTLTNSNSSGMFADFFIVKYDAGGNVIWANSAGGTAEDIGVSVSADAAGNVYATGYFVSSTAVFDAVTLNNAGVYDIFLVKYDASGNQLWAKREGGTLVDEVYSVNTDPTGNVFLAGEFSSPALTFGSTTLTNTNTWFDVFIAKYDPDGNALCASALAARNGNRPVKVCADPSGDAYITGTYTANPFQVGSVSFTGTSSENIFIAKWTCSNNILTAGVSPTDVLCHGKCTGTAAIKPVGGTPPYSYSWSSVTATDDSIGSLCAGNYTVTVSDASGSTTTASFSIIQPVEVVVDTIVTAAACGKNNGSAIVNVNGGTAPYVYSWSNGSSVSSVTGLSPGSYTVGVMDKNNCSVTQAVTVTGQGNNLAHAAVSKDTIIDRGTSCILLASGGVSYSWTPADSLSCTLCSSPVARPSHTSTYCVQVTDANGCSDNACVTITVNDVCGQIFVPTAFSPDDNGQNDRECVRGKCIQKFYFSIYDRWGEKVFESTDPSVCWDGSFQGKRMNTAVFTYYLTATLFTGESVTRKGNVTLIR